MNTSVMFSNKTDQWETPQGLFDALNHEFTFEVDVCALPENAKCKQYYTPETDGLSQNWDKRCWCNPPYGREIGKWVKKATESVNDGCPLVVMLLPARTDTRWFHDYIYKKHETRFLRGRLKFGNSKNGAPFPSMVVVMKKKEVQYGR